MIGLRAACAGEAQASRTRAVEIVSRTRVTISSNSVTGSELRSDVRGGGRRELRGVRLSFARAPLRLGSDGARYHAVAMPLDRGQHRADKLLTKIVRLEP